MTLAIRYLLLLGALGCLEPALVAAGEPEPKFVLKGHMDYVRSMAFSADCKMLVSGSNDSTIRLWDVVAGKPIRVLGKERSFTGFGLAFSPDGKFVATSHSRQITLWPIAEEDGRIVLPRSDKTHDHWRETMTTPIPLGSADLTPPLFSPDGKYVANLASDEFSMKKRPKGKPPEIPLKLKRDKLVVKVADQWKFYAFWDVTSRETVALEEPAWIAAGYSKFNMKAIQNLGLKIEPRTAAISYDSTLLASTHSQGLGPLDVYDLSSGKKVATFPVGDRGDIALVFSPDGTMLAAGGRDRNIRVWDVSKFKQKKE